MMAAAKRPGVQYRDSPLSKGPTIDAEDIPKDQMRRRSSEKRQYVWKEGERGRACCHVCLHVVSAHSGVVWRGASGGSILTGNIMGALVALR